GSTVRVGTVVARIAEAAPALVSSGVAASSSTPAPVSPERPRAGAVTAARPTAPPTADEGARGLSPAVRRLVTEHSLDPAAIAGTGKDGRLIKEDVLRHVTERAPDTGPAPASPSPAGSGRLTTGGERAAGGPPVE